MELGDLSSNWRALQKKLQAQKTTNGQNAKRKREVEEVAYDHKAKIPKQSPTLKSKGPRQRRAMNTISNAQRARSKSAPQDPAANGVSQHSALKSSASHADLRQAELADPINVGNSQTHVAGKYIAIDCEMVGTGPAPHTTSQLARVSLVNIHGEQVYDSFVSPKLPVTDYRTHVSGITSAMLARGRPFEEVQQDVGTLLNGRILVGHAVKNDLAVLLLSHPKSAIRDTSHYKPWKEQYSNGGIPSLRLLVRAILGWESFQEDQHSSVEDARAAMMLFKSEKDAFEVASRRRFGQAAGKPQISTPAEDLDADDSRASHEGAAAPRKKKKKKRKGKN